MPTIYNLKPKFQYILRPLTRTLARLGVTPNQVTLAALLISMITGSLIALKWEENWPLILLPFIIFVRMTLALDTSIWRGGGKYGIEVLKGFDTLKIKAEFRDYKKENIDNAKQNAQMYELTNICFKQADAFEPENYDRKWDVIVSSGFWENVNDDNLVKGNLINIAKCLNSGSVLVFTIQPNQPQPELIARTLTTSRGTPWTMRLRSLELWQRWIEMAGLQNLSHRMEKYGIYGVVEAIML